MLNWIPHRDKFDLTLRRHPHLRAWLVASVTLVALVALALVWVQPIAAQAVGPVYALPGTLSRAVNRSYDTILTISNGTQYGLVGQNPEIEAQIVQYRSQGAEFEVKVWGDRYPAVVENDLEYIVVSSVQPAEPIVPTPASTATPTVAPTTAPTAAPTATPRPTTEPTPAVPIAIVSAQTVNVRSGPGTDYVRVGSLVEGQACAIIGRNQSATWWQLSCPGATSGWVFGELLVLAGPVSTVPVVQSAPPPTPVPPSTFPNWRTTYYANRTLSGTPVLTVDEPNINFNWGSGSPGSGVPSDNFSARFERTLNFTAGTYEILLTVDDGARLFIDDAEIINAWREASVRTRTTQVVLSGAHRFRVEYFEAGGTAQLQLNINFVSGSQVWTATYYRGQNLARTPILSRGEARGNNYQLDYNWGGGGPGQGLPVDDFSARWVGTFNFQGGDYRFNAITDDGIRVYLDGILILDRWVNGYHGDVTNTFRNLGPGNHEIIVEYYESYGIAQVRVWWERLNTSGGGGDDSGRPRDE